MPYERTQQIEQRFVKSIDLIKRERLNAGQLASALEVSRPTIQRIVAELKRRGYCIRSIRDDSGWRYELMGGPT